MPQKVILFDLDGTLLPMDQDAFIKKYFTLLAAKMAPLGFEPQTFIKAMWAGIEAMMKLSQWKIRMVLPLRRLL